MISYICYVKDYNLTEVEKSILKCSCWLHDLGCIYDRDNHADESVKIIEILCKEKHINLKKLKKEVETVVQTHSSKGLLKLDRVELERKISPYPNVIRLKLLCALFKIADECHIDRLRAPEAVYDVLKNKMPEESKLWWTGHENVTSVDLSFEKKKIIVRMSHKGDIKIVKSLDDTLRNEKIKSILDIYKFPCTALEIKYTSKGRK